MDQFSELSPLLAEAKSADAGRLQTFRLKVRPSYEERGGKLYHLWDTDEGLTQRRASGCCVFLPGGMGHGEIWFPFILPQMEERRCLAFSIPHCQSFEEYADAVASILKERGVQTATIVGQSVGGLAAQVFARRHKDMTLGLALCMTGAPAADLPAGERRRWTDRRLLRLRLSVLPFGAAKRSMGREAYVRNCPDAYYDRLLFWKAYLEESYEHAVYKQQHVAINAVMLPRLYAGSRWAAGELGIADERVLVLYSEADKTFRESDQAALSALYPGAARVNLGDAGQLSMHAHEDAAVQLVAAHARMCAQ